MSVQLVGILNITPDSFSDGGLFLDAELALAQVKKLFDAGANIIDVGAESTNPKKTEEPLRFEDELERLLPILEKLIPTYSGCISVDTFHPETVNALAEKFGPSFIANDVSGMNNPAMREVVAKYGLTCVVSHLPAKFGTGIQAAHRSAKLDDARAVRSELLRRRQQLIDLGLAAEKIILDPGIGFGKTMRLNWELLTFAKLVPGVPVMIGYSKKRFLATDPKSGEPMQDIDRYDTSVNDAAGEIAIASGAQYLRVHEISSHLKQLAHQL